jgi:hypothetical protein
MGKDVLITAILAPHRDPVQDGESEDTTHNFYAKNTPVDKSTYMDIVVESRKFKYAKARCSHMKDEVAGCTFKACYILCYRPTDEELVKDGLWFKTWGGRKVDHVVRDERMMTGYQNRYLYCV